MATYEELHAELMARINATIKERDELLLTVRSIRDDCRRGADTLGMTAEGVRDIARRCDNAIARCNIV